MASDNDLPTAIPIVDPRATRNQDLLLRRPLKKQLFIGLLTGSSATLYTAPAAPVSANSVGINPVTVIESLWICNTDAAPRTVTLYLVENGGSIGANRTVLAAESIAANSHLEINTRGGWVLEASGTLRGLASVTNVVNVLVNGTEYL